MSSQVKCPVCGRVYPESVAREWLFANKQGQPLPVFFSGWSYVSSLGCFIGLIGFVLYLLSFLFASVHQASTVFFIAAGGLILLGTVGKIVHMTTRQKVGYRYHCKGCAHEWEVMGLNSQG